jgi:nucleoside-diphosphate-sugar epimerase
MAGNYVVVTGAGGFIGGHLVADLLSRGQTRVRAVDCKAFDDWHQVHDGVDNIVADLRHRECCNRVCAGAEAVYQLAADMGGMGFIETHKAECMLSVLINTHMLLAAREHRVQRYFYASSACVYNADKQIHTDVTALREADAYPAQPEDGYGWEKLFSERMCRHFREDFGLETRVARYHNIYGPHGTWQGGREKAPAAICRKVVEAKIHRDLGKRRADPFVHVHRRLSRRHPPGFERGRERAPQRGFERTRVDQSGIELVRHYEPDAPIGVNGRNSDNTRIRQVFDWEPSVPLRTGLEKTYKWIHDEYVKRYAGQLGPRAETPLGAHVRMR